MGISSFRLKHFLPGQYLSPPNVTRHTTFLRNFRVCPHCEKKGRPAIVERLNKCSPVISRSDGESFHLVLGDRPISFPADRWSGKASMTTAGFWYVSEQDRLDNAPTKSVVVVLGAPVRGLPLLNRLEFVADRLSEQLVKHGQLGTYYELSGHQLFCRSF